MIRKLRRWLSACSVAAAAVLTIAVAASGPAEQHGTVQASSVATASLTCEPSSFTCDDSSWGG